MGHILKGKEGQGKRAHIPGVPSRGHIYHFHIIISGEIGKWGTHFRGNFWARGSMINLFVYCFCWSRWSMDVEKKRSECWSRKKNQKCSKSHTKSVYPFCKLYFCKTLWIMLLKSRLFFHQILIKLFKTCILFFWWEQFSFSNWLLRSNVLLTFCRCTYIYHIYYGFLSDYVVFLWLCFLLFHLVNDIWQIWFIGKWICNMLGFISLGK